MNTQKIFQTAVIALFLLLLSSCKKDSVSANVSTTIQNGSWKISLFNDSGNDETNHFTGYSFNFGSGGAVSASNGSSSVSGSWSTGNDDSQNKLNLNFGDNGNFGELSDDWHIISESSTKIELEDVSGGNGGTDLLTFVKN
jgi:hypothetical protein